MIKYRVLFYIAALAFVAFVETQFANQPASSQQLTDSELSSTTLD